MAKLIGKYEIIRTLGQGAMGEVFLAHHSAIGRDVAIKTILPSVAKGEEAEERFRREAEAVGKLSHPNLVTLFDFDKDQDLLFLVMEFVKGEDLSELILSRSLSSADFLEVLAQVCEGLNHAHSHGIIHRDIKPSNIRVLREGHKLQAKVMDFGIARVEDSSMTATGIVMGTVNYMAPEYIREGRATPQADLFAVGVMLYEGLTGSRPFTGDNTTTVLFKIVSDPPPPIQPEHLQGISPTIRLVLDQALAKDPAERFQTGEDLARALRACKDPTWSGQGFAFEGRGPAQVALPAGEEGTVRLPSSGHRAPVPPPVPQGRRGGMGLVLAAGLGILAVGGGLWLYRAKGRQAPPTVSEAPLGRAEALGKPEAGPLLSQPAAANAGPAPVASVTAPAPPVPSKVAPPSAPASSQSVAAPSKPAPVPPREPLSTPKADPPEVAGRQAAGLLGSDPRQAALLLKPLVQANPGNLELNATYLAALYRSSNPAEFGRALSRASASGVTTKAMFSVPAFRAAMIEERNLRKAEHGAGLLPAEVMDKVLAGL